jgi:hypothetical protein
MQKIELFFKPEEYTLESVSEIIGRKHPDYSYYGTYERKNPILTNIYRFYKRTKDNKKKLYQYCHPSYYRGGKNPPYFSWKWPGQYQTAL